jgi:phage antirepressor YoqD-like protein
LVFEGKEVQIEVVNDVVMFEIYSVGSALGYSRWTESKGKRYFKIEKSRIDKIAENAEISTLAHGGQTFITESQLYDFMLEARSEKCKTFRRWITDEVLPQIRITGGYIPINSEMTDLEIMTKAMEIMQKTVEQKEELLLLQQPKVENYERLMDSKGLLDMKEYAKTAKLKVGRNIFMSVLRDNKILMEDNTPYQQYVSQGYFKTVLSEKNGHSYIKTLVTKKGVEWLNKKTIEWELYQE